MAFLTFIARQQPVASCRLAEAVELGRSLDAGIFVPDIFVSRRHCRFEQTSKGWTVVDLDSKNGIYFRGRRITRRLLHHDDVIEIGSIAVMFDENDLPEGMSSHVPFGSGIPLAELVDTLFAGGTRPAEYARQKMRKPAWAKKDEEDEVPVAVIEEEEEKPAWDPEEWTELDMEFQIAEADAPPALVFMRADAVPMERMEAGAGGEMRELESLIPGAAATAVTGTGNGRPMLPSPRRLDPSHSALGAATAPGGAVAGGPKGAAVGWGGKQNLWDAASGRVPGEEDGDSDKRKKGRKTKEEKAHEKEAKKKSAAVKKKKPKIKISLRERIEEFSEQWGPAEMLAYLKERPMAVAGLVAAIMLGYGVFWFVTRPPKPPLVLPNGTPNPAYYGGGGGAD